MLAFFSLLFPSSHTAHNSLGLTILHIKLNKTRNMGSKAPSWADQWGTDGSADKDYDDKLMTKVGNGSSSKMVEAKAAASAGLVKAKAAAAVGAQKVKSGTSAGIKWVKNQCQKKASSK